MRSIQRRLSLGLVGALLLVGLPLAQTSLWLLDLSLRGYLQGRLQDEAETLLIALVSAPQGIQLDEKRLSAAYQRPYSGAYFRIDFADQHWRSRSLWDFQLPPAPVAGLQTGLGDGPRGQLLLSYRGDYQRFGRAFTILVAQDYTPVSRSLRRAQQLGLGLGLGGLLLVLLLQRMTVSRALRPLEQSRQQIAQLQQGSRSKLDSQVPRELEPLVAQINHLLAHTEDTLKRSRNALGDLGHSLKTPLAVLFSLASRDELKACPELRDSLLEQLQQIEQRLARELGRARLAGDALPGKHFDCADELPGLFATLAIIHGSKLQLDWQAEPGLRLPWDREDLLELLGNLLDNACKWARGQARVSIRRCSEGYLIEVDDDGPGIAAESRPAVLNRGKRLDERVHGHGLGLGIVSDIVEAWGGSLSLHDSGLGGLNVRIVLPKREGLRTDLDKYS